MDVDNIRLVLLEGLRQNPVVDLFQRTEFAEGLDARMLEDTVEEQTPFDGASALLLAQTVGGSEHLDGMPTQPEGFGKTLATNIVGAGVVRWV
jgi:hypothetical protein